VASPGVTEVEYTVYHGGFVYDLHTRAATTKWSTVAATLSTVERSFRSLTSRCRASIQQTALQVCGHLRVTRRHSECVSGATEGISVAL
jgi:predicted Zn-dependent protease